MRDGSEAAKPQSRQMLILYMHYTVLLIFCFLHMSTILVLRDQNSFKLEAYNLPFKVAIATGLTSSHPEQSS